MLARPGADSPASKGTPSASRTFFSHSTPRLSLPGGLVVSMRTYSASLAVASALTLSQSIAGGAASTANAGSQNHAMRTPLRELVRRYTFARQLARIDIGMDELGL